MQVYGIYNLTQKPFKYKHKNKFRLKTLLVKLSIKNNSCISNFFSAKYMYVFIYIIYKYNSTCSWPKRFCPPLFSGYCLIFVTPVNTRVFNKPTFWLWSLQHIEIVKRPVGENKIKNRSTFFFSFLPFSNFEHFKVFRNDLRQKMK